MHGGRRMVKGYGARDHLIRKMGYRDYRHYLSSPLWKKLRADVLERDNYLCKSCGRRATEVHHSVYNQRSLGGRCLTDLVSLCRECHQWIEFTRSGKKRDTKRVTRITRLMMDDP